MKTENFTVPAGEQEIHTVSYDEKPGIQAIATTAPDLPPTVERIALLRGITSIND